MRNSSNLRKKICVTCIFDSQKLISHLPYSLAVKRGWWEGRFREPVCFPTASFLGGGFAFIEVYSLFELG